MTIVHTFSSIDYVARTLNIIASLGVELEVGGDFSRFCGIPDEQPLRHRIAPIFNPECSDISDAKGFWMIGRNDKGEIVCTQAIRLVDLNGANLDEHLKSHLQDYRPDGDNFEPARSQWFLTPEAAAISGDVAYYGELWLKGGEGGFRGGCMTAIMPRVMFALSMIHWSPDFVIGIMEPMAALKGLAAREGYMHVEQRSILWHDNESPAPLEEWFVWMDRTEAQFNLRVPPETFFELYEKRPLQPPEIRLTG